MVKLRLLRLPVRAVPHGVPGVEVRIEVHNRNGLLVDLVQSAQSRQRNAVISTKRYELGVFGADPVRLGCFVHDAA